MAGDGRVGREGRGVKVRCFQVKTRCWLLLPSWRALPHRVTPRRVSFQVEKEIFQSAQIFAFASLTIPYIPITDIRSQWHKDQNHSNQIQMQRRSPAQESQHSRKKAVSCPHPLLLLSTLFFLDSSRSTKLPSLSSPLHFTPLTARIIPPKKTNAIATANKKKRQNASVSGYVEEEMISRAASGGPMKLLKNAKKDDAASGSSSSAAAAASSKVRAGKKS